MSIQRYYMDDNGDERDHPRGAWVWYDDHVAEVERIKAERFPLLTADDPEPAVGAIVQDGDGNVYQRDDFNGWLICGDTDAQDWDDIIATGPVGLLWGGARS